MDIENKIESARLDEAHSQVTTEATREQQSQQRKVITIVVIAGVVILALLIAGIVLLALPSTDTARIRDIFIIFMALQSLLLGVALILLIIQLARLTNLLQNEIKPILESTSETINTLRGTTAFLSDNLVEPVIKLNSYMAAVTQLKDILSLGRRRTKNKPTNTH